MKKQPIHIPETLERDGYLVAWSSSVNKYAKKSWNDMMSGQASPFFEWEWFYCLEKSESIGGNTGWHPLYLTVQHKTYGLCAAVPLFLKLHSAGEFGRDYILAETAYKYGLSYYPKLVGMSPFTPDSLYRLYVGDPKISTEIYHMIFESIDEFLQINRIFVCQFLHVHPAENNELHSRGYIQWIHNSYVWENEQYGSFDDFLATLNTKRRKNIRTERRKLLDQNLRYRIKSGDELTEDDFLGMYQFYQNTCDKFGHWGSKYLKESFFALIAKYFKHRCVIFQAISPTDPCPIAMSIFIHKDNHLFGRYWGTSQQIDYLHFELCYYRPIQWCIENGIRLFNAGAGNGHHKVRRGFKVINNNTWHKFSVNSFHNLVENYFDDLNNYSEKNKYV